MLSVARAEARRAERLGAAQDARPDARDAVLRAVQPGRGRAEPPTAALWLFALIDRKPLKMCDLMPVPPLSGKNVWLGVLRNVTAGQNNVR